MNNIFSENIPWSVGLVVVLFGYIAVHRLVLFREKKNRINEASDKFRDIILTEFSKLYPDGILHIPDNQSSEIVRIIRDKHHIISAAVYAYRPHVKNKDGFDKAWNNFTGIDRFRDKDEQPRYNQYSFKNVQGTHFYDSPKEMFIENIDQILEFTVKT